MIERDLQEMIKAKHATNVTRLVTLPRIVIKKQKMCVTIATNLDISLKSVQLKNLENKESQGNQNSQENKETQENKGNQESKETQRNKDNQRNKDYPRNKENPRNKESQEDQNKLRLRSQKKTMSNTKRLHLVNLWMTTL